MISVRTTRKRRPTLSAQNTRGPACSLPPMRRKCGRCFSTTWISVSCSIPPVMSNSLRRSTPRRRSCRPSCGPQYRLRLSRNQRRYRSGGFGHERCVELARLYAGSVVEPDPVCGVGSDGGDRHLLGRAGWIRGATPQAEFKLLLVLPLVVAIAFFLIADIDSPRRGLIHVKPQNLLSLAQSLRAQ